jgi:hypothetical protein
VADQVVNTLPPAAVFWFLSGRRLTKASGSDAGWAKSYSNAGDKPWQLAVLSGM